MKRSVKATANPNSFRSDVYNALADVAYDYEDITYDDMKGAVDWFMKKFFEYRNDEDIEGSTSVKGSWNGMSMYRREIERMIDDGADADEVADYIDSLAQYDDIDTADIDMLSTWADEMSRQSNMHFY